MKTNSKDAKQAAAKRRQLKDLEHKAELSRQAFEAAQAEAQIAEAETSAKGNWLAPELEGKARAFEAKHGDGWGIEDPTYDPQPPYAGAISLSDAVAYLEAQGNAEQMDDYVEMYQAVMDNIMASDVIADKGGAIATAANELQKLMAGMKQLPEAKATETPKAEATAPPPADPAEKDNQNLFQKFMSWVKAGARHSSADQEHLQQAHDHLKMAGADCGMKVLKAADGSYRWVGWVSNKWRDRDTAKHPGGEIISEAAHKEFAGWLDMHPDQAPQWWTWHTPVRKTRADWWDYADGFLLMSGPVPAGDEKGYLEMDEPIAMSHGFITLERDGANGIINQYRSFEVSDLPLEKAANPWTAFDVVRKELGTMGFTADKRAYFVKVFGEERTKQLEAETESMGKALDQAGIEAKDKTDLAKAMTCPACGAAVSAGDKFCAHCGKVLKKELGGAAPDVPTHILDQVKQLLNVDGLNAALTELQKTNKALADQVTAQAAAMAELQKSDDVKIAEKIAPKVKPMTWGYQASAAKDNEMTDEQKAALKVGQSDGWIKDAFADLVH